MNLEAFISYQIEKQFPAIYREDGKELVDLLVYFYKFLETTETAAIYNSRKMFRYRDIDTTLDSMIQFFRNKYLSDLELNSETTRFAVKHILDLYRRRGSEEGLYLFFKLFYNTAIRVYYPSTDILKPSDSKWIVKKYVELQTIDDFSAFESIIGKEVIGSISKAIGIVDETFFYILNNTLNPVLFLESVRGEFLPNEELFLLTNQNLLSKIYGSLTGIVIDTTQSLSGYSVGDILTCSTEYGSGGKALVSSVTETFSGEVSYTIEKSGFGYSKEETSLLVSDQIIILENEGLIFKPLETLEDADGNSAIVIGQNSQSVGVRNIEGSQFYANSVIQTTDRDTNFQLDFISVVPKNDTSPGIIRPEANTTYESISVQVDELDNVETIQIIRDPLYAYADVLLGSFNYNDPPAAFPMSGNTDPISFNTLFVDAFDVDELEVGSIVSFKNIDPGVDYINDVFAIAVDNVVKPLQIHGQYIKLNKWTNSFKIGEEVTQNGFTGVIYGLHKKKKIIQIAPNRFAGFNSSGTILYNGLSFDVEAIGRDYSSESILGYNAEITSETEFTIGKILNVSILDSGFGYKSGDLINLLDDEENIATSGEIVVSGIGKSEGIWATKTSHLNYEDGKRLQDSNYYQDFSYEISSNISINTYETPLKLIGHVAGTKLFGKFSFTDTQTLPITTSIEISR